MMNNIQREEISARTPGKKQKTDPLMLGFTITLFAILATAMTATIIPGAFATFATTCVGEAATITGTPGNDNIVGTSDRDVIQALGGNDRIQGLDGGDRICGGDGNDRIDRRPSA